MREKLEALYNLQHIDLDLAKTQKALASLDDGTSAKQQVDAARQKMNTADKLLHEANTELRDNELNLKTIEAKQQSFRDKLYGGTVSNPKELDSMEKEVEMLGRQKGKLEERILELYDIVEQRIASLAATQEALKATENSLAEHLDKLQQDTATLNARIQELTRDRAEAVTLVDPILLKRYDSMRARLGGVVVSRVEAENCTSCHTQLMAGVARDLNADKEIVTCENCGRLLYIEIT